MSVTLAKTAGFCMGVKRAVDMVLDIARNNAGGNLYTYGPLIHNPQTIEILKKRGIYPVESIEELDEGIVIIRTHGISPDERKRIKEKGLKVVDATCPKVARVQAIIKKHARNGFSVIIVGDKEHPEVKSLLGYASGRGLVVTNEKEVKGLPSLEKVCVVAQTTQSLEEFEKIVAEIEVRYEDVTVFNTICNSTERRQGEIRKLADEMDAIVIVGGKNSANTCRLAMISRELGVPTYHIETSEELKGSDICNYHKIGVSAGASTPNWIISGAIDYLSYRDEDKPAIRFKRLYNFWVTCVRTDLYSALGAGCLTFVAMILQKITFNFVSILVSSTYVYAIHTISRLQDRNLDRIRGSFREESYVRHRGIYQASAIVCLVSSLLLSLKGGLLPLALLSLIFILGVLYNISVLPQSWKMRRLADIPGSKNLSTSIAWAMITAVVPFVSAHYKVTGATVIAFLFSGTLVFVKTALSDMLDAQSDRIIGRETIPIVIGEDRTRFLLKCISLIMGAAIVLSVLVNVTEPMALSLLMSLIYIWICILLYDRKGRLSGIVLEGLFTTNYMVAGFGAGLWVLVSKGLGE